MWQRWTLASFGQALYLGFELADPKHGFPIQAQYLAECIRLRLLLYQDAPPSTPCHLGADAKRYALSSKGTSLRRP